MPEGLLVLDNAPAPPSGMLALQWHLQDGSWQDPSSWSAHPLMQPIHSASFMSFESRAHILGAMHTIQAVLGVVPDQLCAAVTVQQCCLVSCSPFCCMCCAGMHMVR